MKKEHYKYYCKIQPDGRLCYGGWINEEVIPNPLPEGAFIFEEFPDNSDGSDYIFQNGEFVYSPKTSETEEEGTDE